MARSTRTTHLATSVRLSVLAMTMTWIALVSWHDLLELPGLYLGPLILVAASIVLTGVLARWLRAPAPAVVAIQVLGSAMTTSWILTGSPLPIRAAWTRLIEEFRGAFDTAQQYAAPVPAEVPGIEAILIVSGLALMLIVEVVAVTLRRIPLAGLPLLVIFSVSLTMVGQGPSWYVFAATAIAFMALLSSHQGDQVSRWGRSIDRGIGKGDIDPFGIRNRSLRGNATTIGGVATALAIAIPALIPTLNLDYFNFGPGSGGDNKINVVNPIVDLRRDLIRGVDRDLLTVTTDDPDPEYLRIAVLNRFTAESWSSGDRDVPADQGASGPLPELEGVDESVPRQEFDYAISATDDFASTWLPTQGHISRISAVGDWRYDEGTRDFIAGDRDLDTAGLDWTFTSVELDLNAVELANAPSSAGLVNRELTSLPSGLDDVVRKLAQEVTARSPSRFQKAVALQNWFRRGGGFTYDDSRVRKNGNDDLARFLTEGPDGRIGYCEQFAASMAVMARILGIPARVAVGFLRPVQVGPQTYVYSSHDLHAWPELFIAGAGWVRFEPTPGGRAQSVPAYTTQPLTNNAVPSQAPSQGTAPDRTGLRDSALPSPDANPADTEGSGGVRGSWAGRLGLVGLLLLAGVVALLPRSVRGRRRERRLWGSVEDVWLELRDTMRDLGLPWPAARSPRQTAKGISGYFGLPADDFTPERPARGPEVNPGATDALERLVLALELLRYAERDPGAGGSWRTDGQTCIAALIGGATPRARRRASWWPRSLFVRSRVTTRSDDGGDSPAPAYAGTVDRVG